MNVYLTMFVRAVVLMTIVLMPWVLIACAVQALTR